MADRLWKKIDCGILVADAPVYLDETDTCYYALDYVSGGGFRAGDGNDLISNFQKPVSLKNTGQWKHKERAIEYIGAMVASALSDGVHIAAMPTSKVEHDPEYDDRLIRALAAAKKRKPPLMVHRPIGRSASSAKAKSGSGSRNPAAIIQDLTWLGFDGAEPEWFFLFDDVITTGGHFKACVQLTAQHCPKVKVAGLFCAKTMWPKPTDDSTTITLG